MRRFIPLSRNNAFQHFSYIYIPGTRFYPPAASCACKIVQPLRKERELLVEPVTHPFVKMFSRIMISGDLGESFIQAGIPDLPPDRSLSGTLIKQQKTVTGRTGEITRPAFHA